MARKRFLIAGMQRSGTTVTQRIVQEHPQACMTWAEVAVEPFFGAGVSAWTFGNEAYAEREAAYPALFDALTRLHADQRATANGMKVAIHDREQAILLANALREYLPDVRLVLTVREDLVAQFGSLLRARRTGEWHSWGAGSGDDVSVRIDEAEFVDYARGCLDIVAQLRAASDGVAVFEVGYERDILGGTDPGPLFDFLGVDRVPVTWRTPHKTAPKPRDYIENYDAMRRVLAELPVPSADEARDAARARLVERAAGEQDYTLVRRAERWYARGDDTLAAVLAFSALAKAGADTPARVWLPCVAVLDAVRHRLCDEASEQVGRRLEASECQPARELARALRDDGDPRARIVAAAASEDVSVALGLAASSLERAQHDLAAALARATLEREPPPRRDETEWAAQLLEQAWSRAPADENCAASESLTRRFDGDPALWQLHAMTLMAAGQGDEAGIALERALALDPGRIRARALLESLR